MQDFRDRVRGAFDIGTRQIDFVDDRKNGQMIGHSEIDVRDGLGLDTLGGINQEQGALHMPRDCAIPHT